MPAFAGLALYWSQPYLLPLLFQPMNRWHLRGRITLLSDRETGLIAPA